MSHTEQQPQPGADFQIEENSLVVSTYEGTQINVTGVCQELLPKPNENPYCVSEFARDGVHISPSGYLTSPGYQHRLALRRNQFINFGVGRDFSIAEIKAAIYHNSGLDQTRYLESLAAVYSTQAPAPTDSPTTQPFVAEQQPNDDTLNDIQTFQVVPATKDSVEIKANNNLGETLGPWISLGFSVAALIWIARTGIEYHRPLPASRSNRDPVEAQLEQDKAIQESLHNDGSNPIRIVPLSIRNSHADVDPFPAITARIEAYNKKNQEIQNIIDNPDSSISDLRAAKKLIDKL